MTSVCAVLLSSTGGGVGGSSYAGAAVVGGLPREKWWQCLALAGDEAESDSARKLEREKGEQARAPSCPAVAAAVSGCGPADMTIGIAWARAVIVL